MAIVSQAAVMVTSLDWQFSTSANPASPTAAVNPSGATATLSVNKGATGVGYVSGTWESVSGSPGFGTASGLWNTSSGSFQLGLGAQSVTPGATLTYTLQIDQCLADFALPGTLVISGNPERTSRVETQHVSVGSWNRDTYTWTVNPVSGPLTLTITAGAGTGDLLVDRIQWGISGDLAAVPEPMLTQSVAAAGLALFGLWCHRRRKI
jgi:hypothetical protein